MLHGGALIHIILCQDSSVIAASSHFSSLFLDVTVVRQASSGDIADDATLLVPL